MSGLLNKALTNGTVQQVAEVPAAVPYSLLNILIINPTGVEAEARVFATNQVEPTLVDEIDHRAVLAANGGRVEYSCVNCSGGEKIFVQAPNGCVVRVTAIDAE